MTYKEALQIMKNRVEKTAQAEGSHWKRKDGSQWTNHNGQIVPFNPAVHGNRPETAPPPTESKRVIPESLSDKKTLRASINSALTRGKRGMSKDEINEMLMHRMELDSAIASHKRG